MAIQKIPYSTLLQDLGATHRWPLWGSGTVIDVLNNEVFNGPGTDLRVRDMRDTNTTDHYAMQSKALFGGLQEAFLEEIDSDSTLEFRGIPSHVSNQGLTDWTLIFFKGYSSDHGTVVVAGDFKDVWGTGSNQEGRLMALMYDSAAGDFVVKNVGLDGSIGTSTFAGSMGDLGQIRFSSYQGNGTYGEVAFLENLLTDDDLRQIHEQRRYFGILSGTATVDGSGAACTIRAFTRDGGFMTGETTAAADGTYELYVRDPAEMDILAIPPAGVAARPLAHGPIMPDTADVG